MTPTDTTPALPPLPVGAIKAERGGGDRGRESNEWDHYYTADQMSAYALQSIASDRAAREGAKAHQWPEPAATLHLFAAELVPTLAAALQRRGKIIFRADQAEMQSVADDTAASFARDIAEFAAPRGEAVAQPGWREHVEQRLLTWRQRFVNKSGDQLALDDFMDKESLDDLIDFVCDEFVAVPSPTAGAVEPQAEPWFLSDCDWDGEDPRCDVASDAWFDAMTAFNNLTQMRGMSEWTDKFRAAYRVLMQSPLAATPPTPAREGPTEGEQMVGEPMLRLLNAELIPTLVAALKRRGHTISPEDQSDMQSTADELVKDFAADYALLAATPKPLPIPALPLDCEDRHAIQMHGFAQGWNQCLTALAGPAARSTASPQEQSNG